MKLNWLVPASSSLITGRYVYNVVSEAGNLNNAKIVKQGKIVHIKTRQLNHKIPGIRVCCSIYPVFGTLNVCLETLVAHEKESA